MRSTITIETARLSAPFANAAQRLVSWPILRLLAAAYVVLMLGVWAMLFWLWSGGSGGFDRDGVVLGPDFPAFYTGGWLVQHGETPRLYDLQRQYAVQQMLLPESALSAYVNPPQYSLFGALFSWLSYRGAFFLWTSLMGLAFVTSIILLVQQLPMLRSWRASPIVALALLAAPVYYALSAGQNTGLSLLLHTGILLALMRRQDYLAGLLIAVGMYKPQIFVGLLPLLLITRRWQALAAFGLTSGVIGVSTLWFFGIAPLLEWLALLRSPLYQAEELRQAAKMFSWQPFWYLVLGQSIATAVLQWISILAVFAGLCWAWWRLNLDLPLQYAIMLCALIVIGPHLPVYDLALLILPGLIFADRLLRMPVERGLGLRVMLLTLYGLLLFAGQVSAIYVVLIVPLITLVGLLAAYLPADIPATPAHLALMGD